MNRCLAVGLSGVLFAIAVVLPFFPVESHHGDLFQLEDIERDGKRVFVPHFRFSEEATYTGEWEVIGDPGKSWGIMGMRTKVPGASCKMRISGSRFLLLGKIQPDGGTASIWIDGVRIGDLPQFEGRDSWRDYWTQDIPGIYGDGEHTLEFRLESGGNPWGLDPWFTVCGFMGFSVGPRGEMPFDVDVAREPVLSWGPPESDDAGELRDAALFRDGDRLKAFFTVLRDKEHPFYAQIAMAESTDGGRTWEKRGVVLGAGGPLEWDAGGVFSPFVGRQGSRLYMLYSGIRNPNWYYTGPIKLGLATSTDGGVNWTRRPAPVLEASLPWEGRQGVYSPSVVEVGGSYRMYYSTSNSSNPWLVGIAESVDLVHWTKRSDPALDDHNMEEPYVFRARDRWYMVTSVVMERRRVDILNRINLYESADGLAWAKLGPLLMTDQGRFYSGRLGSAAVVAAGPGEWLMMFDGSGFDKKRRLGVCRLTPAVRNEVVR